jgi:hypothetical protein
VGSNPAEAARIFQGEKFLSTPSFGREVKPWVSCSRFVECKRSLNWHGSRNLRQNFRLILVHIVPTFATRISLVVGGTWGHLSANVGTSKHAGGNRVSTISLLGCSTSVALTMGPTDEEELRRLRSLFSSDNWDLPPIIQYRFCISLFLTVKYLIFIILQLFQISAFSWNIININRFCSLKSSCFHLSEFSECYI